MNSENNKNQSSVIDIEQEEQKGMEFLKAQNENITVIDVPEQTREAEQEKKKKKYVNIFEQFLILRVYTTALIAYFSSMVIKIVVTIVINLIFGIDDNETTSTNQEELEDQLKKGLSIPNIFVICVIAPILEEFIFRGIIFKIINWIGKKVQKKITFIGIIIRIIAFLVSSFIFAFAHFAFNFETLANEIRSFPSYFIMGLALAYAYNRDGYLLASIFTHMLNNIIAVILIYVVNYNEIFGYVIVPTLSFVINGYFY